MVSFPIRMVPSILWCSWFPGHVFPWRSWYNLVEVVRTSNPFFTNLLLWGSHKCPTWHKSNWAHWVFSNTSFMRGDLNIADLAGCSQWKWLPWLAWKRSNTKPNARSATWWCRCSCKSWKASGDRDPFRAENAHHGPHIGLYQTFLGFWWHNFVKRFDRPALVCKSPCS